MIKITITVLTLGLLPLIAQEDFLKGVKAEDLMLDRVEAPSAEDIIGINDWSKFFFDVANEQIGPDNKKKLAVQDDGIWVTDLTSGENIQLDKWGMLPQWSPNGHLVAFIRHSPLPDAFDSRGRQLYGGDELWVCKVNGKEKKNLSPGLQCVHFLWCSDNQHIIFDCWNRTNEGKGIFTLAVVDVNIGEIKIIDAGSPYNSFGFSPSPDGKMIAYCKPLKWELKTDWWVTDAELFICNIDGTGKTQITNTEAVETAVKWLNDSKSLIVEQCAPDPIDLTFSPYVKIVLKKK